MTQLRLDQTSAKRVLSGVALWAERLAIAVVILRMLVGLYWVYSTGWMGEPYW